MRIGLRNKYWDFRFVNHLGENIGDVLHDKRWIRVRRGLEPQEELDVTIHELLHAAYEDLGEDAIDQAATDIARLLWKLGYRKEK